MTVSSRLTGEIGSSSNPISGMTVATLLFTCLVFLLVGWTQPDPYFVTALSIGGIVCIAASNGGTTSQDLKTGFWVGGTPKKQQIAILVGALASALVLGPILLALNDSGTVYAGPTTFSRVKDKEVKVNTPVYRPIRATSSRRSPAPIRSLRTVYRRVKSNQRTKSCRLASFLLTPRAALCSRCRRIFRTVRLCLREPRLASLRR